MKARDVALMSLHALRRYPLRTAMLLLVTHDPAIGGRAKRHLTLRDGKIVGDVREAAA